MRPDQNAMIDDDRRHQDFVRYLIGDSRQVRPAAGQAEGVRAATPPPVSRHMLLLRPELEGIELERAGILRHHTNLLVSKAIFAVGSHLERDLQFCPRDGCKML